MIRRTESTVGVPELGRSASCRRRVCVPIPEMGPGRGTSPREPAPATKCERSPHARRPPAVRLPLGREGVSRPRTRATGWKRGSRSRTRPGVAGLPRTGAPGRPRCRRRSPVASVAFQFTEQHGQRGLRWPAAGGLGSRRESGGQPALPHRIGKLLPSDVGPHLMRSAQRRCRARPGRAGAFHPKPGDHT